VASVLDQGANLGETGTRGLPADARDRAFAYHLAYGVLRWLSALQWLSSQLLQRPLKKKDRDVERLLLVGLFQLWQDDAAPHAAVHETAESARRMRKPWAVGLINAVLRRFQREREHWLQALKAREERFAHPEWLLRRLQADWPEEWAAVATANNRPGGFWLRLNARSQPGRTEDRLRESGFSTTRHPQAPDALRLEPASAVENLPGFAEGRFSVQDPAAQLAAALLDVRDGQRILDACAAPGGKTGHILERAPGAQLTALDRSAGRLDRVRENLDRLGFMSRDNLRLEVADAASTNDWWDGQAYQRILLDAPCSATGVIRRHPEIKWLRNAKQIDQAVENQAHLLDRLWPLLDVGGILLYATCSVLHDENSHQVKRFVEARPEAKLEEIAADWGRDLGTGRQILPGEQEMDGFFYARLRKNA
jgi:16S rRNA (cytosine967-C5)-methyltransferase